MKKGQKGFTLIELLIVVAILGILAAVALPNLSRFITTGNIAAANSEAGAVKMAVMAYSADNDGTMPSSTTSLVGYLSGVMKGAYTINSDGSVTGTGGWTGLTWTNGKWVKSQ